MRRLSTRGISERGRIGLLAALYFGLGFAGDRLFAVPPLPWGFFWPPSGLYLAVLLRFPRRSWPLIVAAFGLADVLETSTLHVPQAALAVAFAQAVEALLGAIGIRAVLRARVTLGSIRQVLALVLLGAVLSPLVAGTLGAALTADSVGVAFGELWTYWWMGDLVGVLVTAPFFLTAFPPPRLSRARSIEAFALYALGVSSVQALFVLELPYAIAVPLPFAVLLLQLWAALRLGLPGLATVTLLFSALAGWHAASGRGPFVIPGLEVGERALAVQGVLAVAGFFGLLLAAAIEERRRSEQRQRLLAQVSATLAAARDEAEALQRVVHGLVPAIADGCGLLLNQDEGPSRAAVHHVDPARATLLAGALPLRLPVSWPARPGLESALFVPRVRPAELEALATADSRRAALLALAPSSVLAVPIGDERAPRGQLVLESELSGRVLEGHDAAVAVEVAQRVALFVERERLLRKTQEAVQLRDDFLAIASHELKTPLTSLMLQLQALQRQAAAGICPDSKSMARAHRSLRRLVALIDDMLDATRVDTGRLRLELAAIDLGLVVRSIAAGFEARSPRHRLELQLPDEELSVRADRIRIEQLLSNLLDNAFKYSPVGGTVRVAVRPEGEFVHLSVSDEGIGIPPDQQRWLFDRFFRARNASVRSFGGLGLGLYICRDIVEGHGGRIWLESAVGKGTTFHVLLPRLRAALLQPDAGAGAAPPPPP